MKSILKLNNPLWRTPERRAILDRAVQQSGAELEAAIKQKVLNSTPAGKTYRRAAIRRKIAKRDLKFFRSNKRVFKRKFTTLTNEKTTVGYQFHRASRKGQAPAVDTGNLINSIRSKRIGQLSNRVATSKAYAAILDDPKKLNRPFFKSTADEFKPKFKQNIQEAIGEIL